MRPVNKGLGPGYVVPPTFSWNQYNNQHQVTAAWQALSNITGITTNPLVLTVDASLQIALRQVSKQPPIPLNLQNDYKTAYTAVMAKVSDVYKTATVPLATALGSFCAYCETAIPGLLEVDHVAPESQFPTYSVSWDNFLPACGPCNNTKSSTPNRATVSTFPPGTPPATEADYYLRIRQHYPWPDMYDDTFQLLPNILFFQNSEDNTWYEMDLADSVDLQDNYLVSANIATREVRADLRYDGQLYYNQLVYVQVSPADNDLVLLVGLNKDPTQSSTYDRRAFNRTVAWFSMLDFIRPIMQITDQPQFLLFWPLLQTATVYTGFWSSWVRCLSQFDDLEDVHSLGYWLYSDPNAEDYYPGTNTTNIQLPPRQ